MSGWFYNLGRELGRKAVPAARKGKLIWKGVTGNDAEAWQAEQQLGLEMAEELKLDFEPSTAHELAEFVREVAERLTASLGETERTYHCELFKDAIPNAMSLPGGWIFLSEGLVRGCGENDDELAFLIAHEIAHIAKKHTWDRMISEAALKFASAATARVGLMGGWLRTQGIQMLRTAHSREREFEADLFAYRLGAAAAFGTEGATKLFERLTAMENSGLHLGVYFGSHPAPAERLARLSRKLPSKR